MARDNKDKSSPDVGGARPCPICGKPPLEAFQPFCSKLCADIDLARWLGGRYAIPAEPAEGDDEISPKTRENEC
ncbi:MAG TPA: DNA gyrase inhibitor YacG [Beijerinckiaceae bacterium]|nr:DNA gyrase inhibitor YacG [Beijerinckiaceae bacterium]